MQHLKNYQILGKIAETSNSEVFRARRDGDSDTVIIKALKTPRSTPADIARFKHEYKLIQGIDQDGAIKTLDVIEQDGNLALVLEDFGGYSLESIMSRGTRFSIGHFLTISIQIAEALANLHKTEIIHRSVKPDNILMNTFTGVVKLADFGVAVDFASANSPVHNRVVTQHELAYMSPEQTGRTNRSVDYRADIYSLGVTLYEMLTGKLPFQSIDPMTLIHSHIAVLPEPPLQLYADIPAVLSNIVMKLLAKNKEHRYQNCFGIVADLKECQRQLSVNGKIESFDVAQNDISNKFIIPQMLFGRDKEIEQLTSLFDRVCKRNLFVNDSGTARSNPGVAVMLISGSPGIGKTMLINEIRRSLVAEHGYFISGKFDQFRKDKPYSAITEAFQGFVKQILSESKEKIRYWKEIIVQSVGDNGRIITDLFPYIELIIGPQPVLEVLDPEASKHRFRFVFERFVSVFPSIHHPVVMVLDDLQWADTASLELLKIITTNEEVNHFYVIGSYRNNEVGEGHPLNHTIDEIEATGLGIDRIHLGPILEIDVASIIVNIFKCSNEEARELATLVYNKTHGNPFFVLQFLTGLYKDNEVVLDPKLGWRWNIGRIEKLQVTDNVVDLLMHKIGKLSETAREILTITAAIGNYFDLETLSFVVGRSIDTTLDNLYETIKEGFICYSPDKGHYVFVHDRIQEAAYSLVPDKQKAALHLRIGRKALENCVDKEDLDRRLFYILDQLNFGTALITDMNEREEVAKLNLKAGNKAKMSSAFGAALQYYETGMRFLKPQSWQHQYRLTLDFYEEAAEVAFLSGEYEKTDEFVDVALVHVKSELDKVNVTISRILALKSQENHSGVFDEGVPLLKRLGVNITKNPSLFRVGVEFLRVVFLLRNTKPVDFLDFPEATEPNAIAISRLITTVSASCIFFSNPMLFGLSILLAVRFSVKHGVTPDYAFPIACYGLVVSKGFRKYRQGAEYGDVAFRLMEKLGNKKQLTRTIFLANTMLYHWRYPLVDTILPLKKGYDIGLESGDLDFACFNLKMSGLHSLLIGLELPEFDRQLRKSDKMIRDNDQQFVLKLHSIMWQAVHCLMGKTGSPVFIVGDICDAEKMEAEWISTHDEYALSTFYFSKLCICIVFGEYELARKVSKSFRKHNSNVMGLCIYQYAYGFDSLCKLMLYPKVSFLKKMYYRGHILFNRLQLKSWAHHSPENYEAMYHLTEALRLWKIKKNLGAAEKAFEAAKATFDASENRMVKMFLYEYFANFWEFRGYRKTAVEYMTIAYGEVERWGGAGKLKQLRQKYPELLVDIDQ